MRTPNGFRAREDIPKTWMYSVKPYLKNGVCYFSNWNTEPSLIQSTTRWPSLVSFQKWRFFKSEKHSELFFPRMGKIDALSTKACRAIIKLQFLRATRQRFHFPNWIYGYCTGAPGRDSGKRSWAENRIHTYKTSALIPPHRWCFMWVLTINFICTNTSTFCYVGAITQKKRKQKIKINSASARSPVFVTRKRRQQVQQQLHIGHCVVATTTYATCCSVSPIFASLCHFCCCCISMLHATWYQVRAYMGFPHTRSPLTAYKHT